MATKKINRATFAFDKRTSPVAHVSTASVKTYPSAQYMGLCQFTDVRWQFDREHNYAPSLVFGGYIERLDAINTKFPHNIDTVYFGKNKPEFQIEYKFSEAQQKILVANGFWSEYGVRMPELFTVSKFQLECDAAIEEVTQAYDTQKVPIFNIEIMHPFDNEFGDKQYELAKYIVREQPEESKNIEKTEKIYESSTDIAFQVEEAKKAALLAQEKERQEAYKPKTKEEMLIARQSDNVSNYVNSILDEITTRRDRNNAAIEAEKARQRAEAEALANAQKEPEKDKDIIDFESAAKDTSTDISDLVAQDKVDTKLDNSTIFSSKNDIELNDKMKAFMASMGVSNEESKDEIATEDEPKVEETAEKPDDKKAEPHKESLTDIAKSNATALETKNTGKKDGTSDSGAVSGASGLGVYTFEDQDTAQFEVRADEGKGNEKEDKADENEEKSDDKADNDQESAQSAQPAAQPQSQPVATAVAKSDEKPISNEANKTDNKQTEEDKRKREQLRKRIAAKNNSVANHDNAFDKAKRIAELEDTIKKNTITQVASDFDDLTKG